MPIASSADMVAHVLREIGTAQVSIWTWAIADYEVEAMNGLMGARGNNGGASDCGSERGAAQRGDHRRLAAAVRFGRGARSWKNHAKIARVWNPQYRVLLRGSMNLNFNATHRPLRSRACDERLSRLPRCSSVWA